MQSLRRRVWATRFFENSVPDAFDAHFFNGLLDAARKTEAQAKARLRKACAAADPASLTLEVEACEVIEAVTLLA